MTATTDPATSALALRIGREIHAQLVRQGLTQEDLAERTNRSQQWVSRRITGTVAVDVRELEEIAAALDVPVAALLPPAADSQHLAGGAR